MSVGLVLEGGGTRGAYTSGVLDVLLEETESGERVTVLTAPKAHEKLVKKVCAATGAEVRG